MQHLKLDLLGSAVEHTTAEQPNCHMLSSAALYLILLSASISTDIKVIENNLQIKCQVSRLPLESKPADVNTSGSIPPPRAEFTNCKRAPWKENSLKDDVQRMSPLTCSLHFDAANTPPVSVLRHSRSHAGPFDGIWNTAKPPPGITRYQALLQNICNNRYTSGARSAKLSWAPPLIMGLFCDIAVESFASRIAIVFRW